MKPKDDTYYRVLAFIASDLGLCFSDNVQNIKELQHHLGTDRTQTYAVLGAMCKAGRLRWDRISRTWTVIGKVEAA